MASSAIVPMNAASKVFGNRDMRSYISSFINPYWTNPLFASIEGALLEGRQDLLGEKGYEFRSGEQLVSFVRYYVCCYYRYADQSDFSSILNYAFSAFITRVSHGEVYRSLENNMLHLLNRLMKRMEADRVCEFIQSMHQSPIRFHYGAIYDEWMLSGQGNHVDTLVMATECELEEIVNGEPNYIKQSIESFDRHFHTALTDMFDVSLPTRSMDALYRVRTEPRFIRLGAPSEYSDALCKALTYARIGKLDNFVSGGNMTYLRDCIECIEQLDMAEKAILSESPYMNQFMEELFNARDILLDMTDNDGSSAGGETLMTRLDAILEYFWTM